MCRAYVGLYKPILDIHETFWQEGLHEIHRIYPIMVLLKEKFTLIFFFLQKPFWGLWDNMYEWKRVRTLNEGVHELGRKGISYFRLYISYFFFLFLLYFIFIFILYFIFCKILGKIKGTSSVRLRYFEQYYFSFSSHF